MVLEAAEVSKRATVVQLDGMLEVVVDGERGTI